MTPESFCHWLKGMSDAIAGIPNKEQWETICTEVDKLVSVERKQVSALANMLKSHLQPLSGYPTHPIHPYWWWL